MALGSVTAVKGAGYKVANKRYRVYDIQLTSGANYTTGGETVAATSLGLRGRIDTLSIVSSPRGTGGAVGAVGVDYGAAGAAPGSVKLIAYFGASSGSPAAEASANTDLSGYTVRVAVTGA